MCAYVFVCLHACVGGDEGEMIENVTEQQTACVFACLCMHFCMCVCVRGWGGGGGVEGEMIEVVTAVSNVCALRVC